MEGIVETLQAMFDYSVYTAVGLLNCFLTFDSGSCDMTVFMPYPDSLVGMCNYSEITLSVSNAIVSLARYSVSWLYDVTNYDPTLGAGDVPLCIGLPREQLI